MAKAKVTPISSTGQAPLAACPLPDEVRNKLGTLVTEVRGASRLLYLDEVTSAADTASAIGLWLERIAHDLAAMECLRYPVITAVAK